MARYSVEEYVQGLREMADFIEAHPDIKPHITVSVGHFTYSAAEFAYCSLQLGTAVKVGDDEYISTERSFGPHKLSINAYREKVCERIVVSKGIREIEEPDPEAIAALPKIKRTEVVEHIEWRCLPLHELARQ